LQYNDLENDLVNIIDNEDYELFL